MLAAALVSFFIAMGIAGGQGLPALSVTALSLTSDRTRVPAGRAFHVTVHVHLAQSVTDLGSLVLPNLVNLTILGDEKHTRPGAHGTDYVEILTLAGIAPGDASLSPAYIDARDPSRGGRAFRFSSNALHITITGEAAPSSVPWQAYSAMLLRLLLGFAILVIAIAVFAALVVRLGARRAIPRSAPPAPQPVAAPVDRAAQIRETARRLAGSRTRADAAAVRGALFAYAGARSDETLGALLARVSSNDAPVRTALVAAERATFIEDANLPDAIENLLEAVRRMRLG